MFRYEGDLHKGGLIDENGDLDNKLKTLIDALRMPHEAKEVPYDAKHSRPVFYSVLEDDRLITRLTLETKHVGAATGKKGSENCRCEYRREGRANSHGWNHQLRDAVSIRRDQIAAIYTEEY
jgi:hypothetical protein